METFDELPGTSHRFAIGGCVNQWHHNHDFRDCWHAFMRHNGRPETTTISEYYDSIA